MAVSRAKDGAASLSGDDRIMAAWERFLGGTDVPQDAIRRLVEDSWRRCLDLGVNPQRREAPLIESTDGLHLLQRRHTELVEAARPVMAQAHEFLAESGTAMALADPAGVILWMEGDHGALNCGENIRLIPGAHWDEGASGTNAIGTAIASGQPVQILAAEHFCEGIKEWTCSAVVIRDPYDGAVLGVLDISGLSGNHNNHCLALVVAGASRIEAHLAKIEMEKRTRLLDITVSQGRWGSDGLVVFDRRGRLVRANENAGLFLNSLGMDMDACANIPVPELGKGDVLIPRALPNWLKDEWLEPVVDQTERLGTLLTIPMPRTRMSSSATKAATAEAVRAITLAGPFDRIVGNSAVLLKAKRRANQLSRVNMPALILGPTGAGKEVFARALHDAGPTASGPFVPLNCGAMTRDLLASELFGYVEGAFTGARRGGAAGKFEAADGGTLFLDEIGEMPLDVQPHFLRVLEEGQVYRLGETKPRPVTVRLVAATNRNLREDVSAGRFRLDLYFRLSVMVLHLPGLTDRKEDIPLLVNHFIDCLVQRHGINRKTASPELIEAMQAHAWPGNVRELRNVVEGMALLSESDILTVDDLPPDITEPAEISTNFNPSVIHLNPPTIAGSLDASERATIIVAINAEGGNLTRAAARLGIAKSTLYVKMKRYNIDRKSD